MRHAAWLGVLALVVMTGTAGAVSLTFTPISTGFPAPIGIDHYEPNNTLVMSVNYPTGNPHSFREVFADGTQAPFSAVSGFGNEVKIATVRSGGVGGFVTGDLFTGNGIDGQIARITAGGATVINPWVDLPGVGNGLMRGSLYVDRTGVYGGDLIAVTTTGQVWRVNSAGVPTMIDDVAPHLEGVVVVPNDVAMYGPLAGKIIAGAENTGGYIYAFDSSGFVARYNVGVNVEDIDLIPENENFYGVNFGTGRLLGVEASQWDSVEGQILLTQEFGGTTGLFTLRWDGATLVTTAVGLNPGSFNPGQWEHVTFSPAGVVEITDVNIPEPGTAALLIAGLAVVGLGIRRRRAARR